ncbi:MAG: hypothetical protein KF905_02310 [Flavobacteriales bacterium]|nr:hypothetical protein [Flavobacteriales bacterium]
MGERFVYGALPWGALIWATVIIRDLLNGVFDIHWEFGVIALLLSVMIWAISNGPAFSIRTSELVSADQLLIDGENVHPKQIKHITPLTARLIGVTPLIEITFNSAGAEKRAVFLVRPYPVPLGMIRNMNGGQTIHRLMKQFPELKSKLTIDRPI